MAILQDNEGSLNAMSINSKNDTNKFRKNPYPGEELAALNESPATPYDPHAHRNIEHPTTNTETLIHILKGCLGTGILAMPDAFKNSGLIVGTVGTFLIGILCTYCLLVLIRCQYEICKRVRKPIISYPDTMKYALLQGPPFLRFATNLSAPIVDGFLIAYQLGICCVYTMFIAENINKVIYDTWHYEMDTRIYTLILTPLLIAITLIRNLKLLAPFSQAANFAMFLGLGILLYYIFQEFPSIGSVNFVGSPIRYTFFIGTTLFALEAVGVVLTLENNMKTPKSFGGVTGILSVGMSTVTVLYVIMGFLGYVKYGEKVYGSITLNIPETILARLVKLIFAFAIYITYALQCYVPVDIIWMFYLKERFTKRENTLLIQYGLRIICVIITILLAIAIPYLNLFISLIGALCLSMLGITFPALIEICILYPNNFGKLNYILLKNVILIIIGIFAGVLGTVLAITDIISKSQS
ncbi:hypothetical protein PGB90_009398 [Kerria lacca]